MGFLTDSSDEDEVARPGKRVVVDFGASSPAAAAPAPAGKLDIAALWKKYHGAGAVASAAPTPR